MSERTIHIIFVLSLFAMLVPRIYYGRKAHNNRKDVEHKESKANRAVRGLFGIGYVVVLMVYVFTPNLFQWGVVPLPAYVYWLGASITAGSLLLLWWVQWALDVQFDTTLHTQAEHKLIQHGPYRWARHPMYTAFFLMGFGWFLLTANWFIGIPLMIGIGLVALSRVKKEEDLLTDLFGDDYRDYMQKTGRYWPVVFTAK